MEYNYLKVLDKLAFVLSDIDKLINETTPKTFEDKKVSILLDNIIDEIKYTIARIEYFKKEPITGFLQEKGNGRFEIAGYELTCGNALEVYSEEYSKWFFGRVEYNDKYYFHCMDLDNPSLYSGIQVRVRI